MDLTLWQALGQLAAGLWALVVVLFTFAWHWILLILWVVWWLGGVNWRKLWPELARGAWAPLTLLVLVAALVWSRFATPPDLVAHLGVPGFWWYLALTGLIVALALFCGWLQGVLHWQPAEINVEPPPVTHGLGVENVHDPAHHH
jgi:hypothetical protein